MKNKTRNLYPTILTVALASFANVASADVTKDDNSDALNVGTSYIAPSTPPTDADFLYIDGTMTAAQTPSLGDDVSVLGIIASSPSSLTVGAVTGKTLTIGASGITKSAAGALTFNNATSLAGDISMTTGTNAITFGGALTIAANQNWTLGSGRINLNSSLITGGNTLNISANNGSSGILSLSGNKTLSTDVTIGTMDRVYVQNGTITIEGISNTNSAFQMFGGIANIASFGNLTEASSIGKSSPYVQSGATLNYTGSAFSSDKGISRDNNGTSTVNVTTAGQTLSLSGNLTSGATATGGWALGGDGNLTVSGNITNGNSTKLTKNGAGTVTLSGANTYTGSTTVTAGTLALVGGSQASPITVNSGASLGLTIGSPSASTSSVTFSGTTAKVAVSGTPAAATLMTAASFSGVPVLDPALPGFTLVTTPTELNLISIAAQGVKADNAIALNDNTSWVGDVPPTASTYLIVDNTLTAARSSALGDNLSVLGITTSSGFGLTIGNTAGKILTIGSSGITLGGTVANTAPSLTLGSSVTLGAAQTWALGTRRLDLTNTLTTGGNALSITGASGSAFRFSNTTFGTDVTIGTNIGVVVPNGTVTINGTNNTNTSFTLFGGATVNIATMGNLGGASSIGTARAAATGTLNYTGTTFSSDKGFQKENIGGATLNVTQAGVTLSMSGIFNSRLGSHTGGFTFGGPGNLNISGNILNAVSTAVTKNGTGTLTLSGTGNTYTGNTSVNQGTLALVGSSLTSPITVNSGAALGFTIGSPATSTSTVNFNGATAKVTISGTPAASTLMTTTGITGTPVLDPAIPGYELAIEDGNTTLKLKVAAGSTYNAWASTNGVSGQAATLDHDNDGVANGIEYFLVGPSAVSTGFTPLPAITTVGATRSITWVKAADYTGSYGTDFIVETSTTLATGSWTTETLGGTVTISGNNVTYTFPAGSEKKFARLGVVTP